MTDPIRPCPTGFASSPTGDASCPTGFATLDARWECATAPAGLPVAVEVTFTPAVVDEASSPRPAPAPLSLGLAIDRSGSMAGGKLEAACRAAVGVLDSLGAGERFAAAAFDDEVLDVTRSVSVDEESLATLRRRVVELRPGGSTALFDGFARAAALVAEAGDPRAFDSWVLVLSDGMGNHGLCDPAGMRRHAAALAERGIRTIAVGIGADYAAEQLTALADGGCGEFHHATRPDEIVEIVLGELGALRAAAARGILLRTSVAGASRFVLLGGDARAFTGACETRFDRVAPGRSARAVLLVWPGDGAEASVSVDASWTGADRSSGTARLETTAVGASTARDVELAGRAADLWHAAILARAMELNERGDYEEAAGFVREARPAFAAYVRGLPVEDDLLSTLDRVGGRVSRRWSSFAHREAYVMTNKRMRGKEDLRTSAPMLVAEALDMDGE